MRKPTEALTDLGWSALTAPSWLATRRRKMPYPSGDRCPDYVPAPRHQVRLTAQAAHPSTS